MISSEIWNDCFIGNIGNDLFEDDIEDCEFQTPSEKSYTNFVVELPLGEKIDITLGMYLGRIQDKSKSHILFQVLCFYFRLVNIFLLPNFLLKIFQKVIEDHQEI